ncbi:VCBS repeat-containing protein [Halobacteriovorax sp. RZ-1]|uniref:FG-GAP repeat domain-containing protein n=1 Tax=unclassified Halobacteriovorax TaxID=2639665 RepID=UPI0037187760
MKYFLITLLFLNSFAAQNLSRKEIDINKDGKVDRIDIRRGKELIEIQEDRNGDGKFEFITKFKLKGIYKQTLQDINGDGKIDRKVSYRKLNDSQFQATIEVDKDFDGVFEIKYKNTQSLIQKQECHFPQAKSVIGELSSLVNKVSASFDDGFLPTDFGYRIENACLSKWGQDFPNFLRSSIDDGIACLKKLGKDLKKPVGSTRIAYELEELLKNNEVTIMCTDKSDDPAYWEGTLAYASVSEETQATFGGKVKHPYMAINPSQPSSLEFTPEGDAERKELRKTLFHEQLHNLGYSHGEGFEFSYACEDCCLSYKGDEENARVDAACRVCQGDYVNENDIRYVRDFLDYSKQAYLTRNGIRATINYIKENPGSLEAQALLASSQGEYFNPIGLHLSTLIISDWDKKMYGNEMANDLIDKIEADSSADYVAYPSGRVVASIFHEAYIKQDPQQTLNLLKDNIESIKKNLSKRMNDTDLYNDYYASNVKDSLSIIIDDLYLNDHLGLGTKHTLELQKIRDSLKNEEDYY